MSRFYLKKGQKKLFFILVFLSVSLIILYIHFLPSDLRIIEPNIRLYLHQQNQTINLEIERYICGVVAAEMPASFSIEALKAQAVCARTYTFKKIIDRHSYPMNANLSDDPDTCQAFISWDEFEKRHPYHYEVLRKKIEEAVYATRGEYISYDDHPIDALYHSTCGGRTESAGDVWMKDVPYLQSVACHYCGNSSYYETVQVFSYQDLQKITEIEDDLNVEVIEHTVSGRAKKLRINGNIMSAAQFRTLLNLPSTCWDFDVQQTELIVNSRGYGHGVGLCQYGANGMAQEGKSYKSILNHYYTGIDLKKVEY